MSKTLFQPAWKYCTWKKLKKGWMRSFCENSTYQNLPTCGEFVVWSITHFSPFFLPQYLNVISDRESSQLQVSSILSTYLDLSWFVPGTTSCIPSIDSSKAFCAVLARPKIESPFFSLRVTSMQFHHAKRPIHKIPQGIATHIPKQNHMNQPDWTRFFLRVPTFQAILSNCFSNHVI